MLTQRQFGNLSVNWWQKNLTVADVDRAIATAQNGRLIHGLMSGIAILDRGLIFPLEPDVSKRMQGARGAMLDPHISMHVVRPKGHFRLLRVGMFIVSSLTLGTSGEVVHHLNVAEALREAEKIRANTRGLPPLTHSPDDILRDLQRSGFPLE